MIVLTVILGIIAGILFFGGIFLNSRSRNPAQSTIGMLATILGLALAFLLAVGMAVSTAIAHDHSRPGLNDWMKGLFSNSKTWCCDGNDNDAIDDWETKDGRYRVKFRGEWFNVPESAIIDGPNKAGDALLWMNRGYLGLSVRCFMPGSLT